MKPIAWYHTDGNGDWWLTDTRPPRTSVDVIPLVSHSEALARIVELELALQEMQSHRGRLIRYYVANAQR